MKNLAFDWNDLKFFLAVARERGLSGAAALLGTSPSTVSRHIDALERRLGATLVLRQQTGYLLTDDGAALLEQLGHVEQAMTAAERHGRAGTADDIAGQVRLATTEMLAVHLVAPHLPRLRARFPRLQVELIISLARVNLSLREADLALRLVAPHPDDHGGDYIATRVGTVRFALYGASRAHAEVSTEAAKADTRPWQERDYVSWDDSWSELPQAKWLSDVYAGKPPALACNSLQTQYAAVRAGLGVGLLPCFISDHDPDVQRVSDHPPLARDVWLVWHRDLKASRRMLAMRDFLQELAATHLR